MHMRSTRKVTRPGLMAAPSTRKLARPPGRRRPVWPLRLNPQSYTARPHGRALNSQTCASPGAPAPRVASATQPEKLHPWGNRSVRSPEGAAYDSLGHRPRYAPHTTPRSAPWRRLRLCRGRRHGAREDGMGPITWGGAPGCHRPPLRDSMHLRSTRKSYIRRPTTRKLARPPSAGAGGSARNPE